MPQPHPRIDPAEAAFREVFVAHAPYVWRCLRRLGVAPADVEDLCQEVFVVVHRKLAEQQPGGPLRAWLYGIALRKVWDHRRLGYQRRERPTDEVPERAVDANQGEALERDAARDLLDRLLDKLDPKQRDVFVLYEIEALGMAEISELLACPLQTAYSRLHAARKQMQAAAARERAKESAS